MPVHDDSQAIADAIVKVMTDSDYWEKVAQGGRAYVASRFSQSALRAVFLQDIVV